MLVHYSSLFIFAPALVAVFLGRWPDAAITAVQAVTSTWHHSTYSRTSLFIDRMAIAAVVVRSFTLSIASYATVGLFIGTFGYMLIIYTYGFYNHCFSFDPRHDISDKYHASIHVLGSLVYMGRMIFFP